MKKFWSNSEVVIILLLNDYQIIIKLLSHFRPFIFNRNLSTFATKIFCKMKLTIIFLLSIFLFFHFHTAAQTQIKGTVTNQVTKEKLQGALVTLKGIKKRTSKVITGVNGDFSFNGLAAGEYDVTVEFVGFGSFTAHVSLAQGQSNSFELAVTLNEKAKSLDSVNVFSKINGENEASSRASEKKANNIINVISAQAMQRSPDVNAANVLQRMSGVTLQKNSGADESYAIVRGLEPRYNNTLINGVKIASPDEKSRYVSLDVVPSDLLEKIEVNKSLLPEMEGDAIGGTVNLVMKDAPDTMVFKALGSLGYSNIFFDRSFVTFSKTDIQQKNVYERFGPNYIAQPGDFSRSNLDFKTATALPNAIAGFTYGNRFLHNKLGILVSENFQNQYYGTNSQYNQAVPDNTQNKPIISDVSNRTFSTQQLNNGLTLHADYNINDKNKIIINNVLLYSALAQSRIVIDTALIGGNGGRTIPGTGPVTTDYTSITDNQLIENVKLEGRHILSSHFLFDWAGVFSSATKHTPDRADLSLNKKIDTANGGFVTTPNYFDNISRIWQHNEDKDYDALANITYRSGLGNDNSVELKAGGLYRHKTRYNQQDEYDLYPTTNANGVKQVFNDIYSAQWTVYNSRGTYDYDVNNYKLFEDVSAGYAQAKFSLKNMDIFGGIRVEHTDQGFTLKNFHPTGINGVTKTYTDYLPSGMVKVKLDRKSNLRLSYFKSISRPNYYELVPARILSNSTSTVEQGNPYLNHSTSDNFDIRYELFPKDEEQLFIGAFYKKIQNPIEYAYLDINTYEPTNYSAATVYGGELVYTKYFGHLGISGNYTYIYSSVHSPKFYTDAIAGTTVEKLQERPLQGQSNNTLNASLLYKDDPRKIFIQLSYEYIGKTLALVYPEYGYDYYRQPQSFLALSAERQLRNRHFIIFGKFNNLLNTATIDKINNLLTVKDVYKANFSLGVRYSN